MLLTVLSHAAPACMLLCRQDTSRSACACAALLSTMTEGHVKLRTRESSRLKELLLPLLPSVELPRRAMPGPPVHRE